MELDRLLVNFIHGRGFKKLQETEFEFIFSGHKPNRSVIYPTTALEIK